MLIRTPCPRCGKRPFRPEHVQQEHDPEVRNLDALVEWAEGVAG